MRKFIICVFLCVLPVRASAAPATIKEAIGILIALDRGQLNDPGWAYPGKGDKTYSLVLRLDGRPIILVYLDGRDACADLSTSDLSLLKQTTMYGLYVALCGGGPFVKELKE